MQINLRCFLQSLKEVLVDITNRFLLARKLYPLNPLCVEINGTVMMAVPFYLVQNGFVVGVEYYDLSGNKLTQALKVIDNCPKSNPIPVPSNTPVYNYPIVSYYYHYYAGGNSFINGIGIGGIALSLSYELAFIPIQPEKTTCKQYFSTILHTAIPIPFPLNSVESTYAIKVLVAESVIKGGKWINVPLSIIEYLDNGKWLPVTYDYQLRNATLRVNCIDVIKMSLAVSPQAGDWSTFAFIYHEVYGTGTLPNGLSFDGAVIL